MATTVTGSGDRTRFAAALGRTEPEFDLVEHRESLAPLLAALPERERRILLLRFFGGMTQTEIAAPGRDSPRCTSPACCRGPWPSCAAN